MTTAILKSFNRDQNVAILSVQSHRPDCAFRLCGRDRSVVAHLTPGQLIRFNISCNRHGELFAIDVAPVPSTAPHGSSCTAQCKPHEAEVRILPTEPTMTLDWLLASDTVCQMMARDGVDPSDVRRLIVAMADARRS
jgi:hypothetical protein